MERCYFELGGHIAAYKTNDIELKRESGLAKKAERDIKEREDEIKGLRRYLVDIKHKHSIREGRFERIRRANISMGTRIQLFRKEAKADKAKLKEQEERMQAAGRN